LRCGATRSSLKFRWFPLEFFRKLKKCNLQVHVVAMSEFERKFIALRHNSGGSMIAIPHAISIGRQRHGHDLEMNALQGGIGEREFRFWIERLSTAAP
jgi:hypothetical protein